MPARHSGRVTHQCAYSLQQRRVHTVLYLQSPGLQVWVVTLWATDRSKLHRDSARNTPFQAIGSRYTVVAIRIAICVRIGKPVTWSALSAWLVNIAQTDFGRNEGCCDSLVLSIGCHSSAEDLPWNLHATPRQQTAPPWLRRYAVRKKPGQISSTDQEGSRNRWGLFLANPFSRLPDPTCPSPSCLAWPGLASMAIDISARNLN